MNMSMPAWINVTIVEIRLLKWIDMPMRHAVNSTRTAGGASYRNLSACEGLVKAIKIHTSNLALKIGRSANIWIENNMSAKTEISLRSRDARTTEADIAAFMDRTDVNLERRMFT